MTNHQLGRCAIFKTVFYAFFAIAHLTSTYLMLIINLKIYLSKCNSTILTIIIPIITKNIMISALLNPFIDFFLSLSFRFTLIPF